MGIFLGYHGTGDVLRNIRHRNALLYLFYPDKAGECYPPVVKIDRPYETTTKSVELMTYLAGIHAARCAQQAISCRTSQTSKKDRTRSKSL